MTLVTIIVSFLITYFLVPLINKYGIKYNFLDFPNSRKQHKIPIVRIGGLAILIGFLITLFIILKIDYYQDFGILRTANTKFFILILCSSLFFLIGFLDDLKRKSPYLRLFLQFAIATLSFSIGISLNISFLIPKLSYLLPESFLIIINYLLTTFYIVGLTNAVNWWDGLDGLAAGTVSICLIFLLILNLNIYGVMNTPDFIFNSALIGSCCGFLKHNYKPAKIIMGDGGAYFIGYCLSSLTLLTQGYQISNVSNNLDFNWIKLLPFFISLPFLADMTKVIVIRSFSSKILFKPDRLHLHHYLLSLGFTEEKAVNQIYALVFTTGFLSLILIDKDNLLIKLFVIFIFFITFTLVNFNKKLRNYL